MLGVILAIVGGFALLIAQSYRSARARQAASGEGFPAETAREEA